MWSIWRWRNDRLHGISPIDTKAAINWAIDACFQLISVDGAATDRKGHPTVQCWQRPPAQTVKVNVDGVFAAGDNTGGVGAVARNAEGEFLMRLTKRRASVASALTTEAEALRIGLQMIHSATGGSVIMETDSLQLVNLWHNRNLQRSELAPIFLNIQELALSFSSFSVVHAKRSANRAAHTCAQFAASCAFDVWANDPPSFILQTLQDDCNHATD
jgi:ribonuclease HI